MPFFAIASRFVTFFGTGMPKSLTQPLKTFLLFFSFSFFPCFCQFAAIANCQLPVQEFLRKHHPKGKFLPSDEEGHFSSVFKVINLYLYIFEAQYHSALGIIAGLVSLPSTGFLLL